ncbi:vWA domain-containing protein [Saccharothrix coeruleofusca]|uniref:VWFA domain-containing protein n=1 Tax=Saccharothrix coeruleofusca TaxID=33919 RepID=A0A918APZ6_9PSEU|nr:vWA domain-containing protein [Saccharothrix coeruleofusca]GGP68644.1 hypothetical protein GCM10010185_46930 [Saccharothrix coeruleofusca]
MPVGVAEGAAQQPGPTLPPLRVVVLVDESGSLSDADVVKEKEAARTILFSALAPGTVMSVAGFGSSNAAGQSAVDVVCPPTTLANGQGRDAVAKCVDQLARRKPEEGSGTDHAAALQQALSAVRGPGPDKKIVFLLTDGELDVADSPQWGDTPERRNAAAAAGAREVLGELEREGAQVWPLGFGEVNDAALGGFARGRSCTAAAPSPSARTVPTSAELTRAVADAISAASCVKIIPSPPQDLPAGGSAEFTVTIPAIAADASIVVYKRNPKVQVEYRAAGAARPAPEQGGGRFEFAGQSTDTESVLITDPTPGEWRVRVSSATEPAQDVFATVVYQAAVRTRLTATPPAPEAGQTVEIAMQVWARDKAVTDRQALEGLTFVTALTGSSGFPAREATLTDPDGDGTFTGQLTVPDDAEGELKFTGTVTGVGVGGDTRELFTRVHRGARPVQGQILLDEGSPRVLRGERVKGTLRLANSSGRPARLRLQIADPPEGASLTVDPAAVEAPTGAVDVPFTLAVGQEAPLGGFGVTLRLVDEADPTEPVVERLVSREVVEPPGWPERNLWWLIPAAVAVLALAALALARLRAARRGARVTGLRAQLWRDGAVRSEVEPRDARSRVFGFTVHEDFTGPQLQQAADGEPGAYRVRRDGTALLLTSPGRPPARLTPGERHPITPNLEVAIVDDFGSGSAPPSPGAQPPPVPSAHGAPSFPPPGGGARPDPLGADDRRGFPVDPNNPFA